MVAPQSPTKSTGPDTSEHLPSLGAASSRRAGTSVLPFTDTFRSARPRSPGLEAQMPLGTVHCLVQTAYHRACLPRISR